MERRCLTQRQKAEFSRKMTALSCWGIIAVAVIHSRNFDGDTTGWVLAIEKYLTLGLMKWAVPFFFVASGFWFARDAYFRQGGYWKLMHKKVRSLVIPYLLWAIIGLGLVLPLVAGNNFLSHRQIWERTPLGTGSLWMAIDQIFGITLDGPWGCGVLWFVRALIFFFAVAPIWKMISKLNGWFVLTIGVAMLVLVPPLKIPLGICGWCVIGMAIARLGWTEIQIRSKGRLALSLGALGVVYLVLAAYSPKLVPLAGIPFWWFFYDLISHPERPLPIWFHWTFWIFCTHQIAAGYVIAIGRYCLGTGALSLLGLMVVTPFVCIFASIASFMIIRKWTPRLHEILAGGRV